MKLRFELVVAALLVVALVGPKTAQAAEKKLTIAFSFQDLETEFWVAGHKAISETLAKRGFKVIEKNCSKDANLQLEQVKGLLTQKIDGIIIIPVDGELAVTIGKLANQAQIPYAVFNRPPSNKEAKALVVVADNRKIAADAVEYMAEQAKKLGRKVTPAIMVGDLGDPNAVGRRQGFYDAVEKYPDLWTDKPIEIPTKWDANVALANLQSAIQANPNIDFLFTSSDFLFPVIKSVLAPLGKWEKSGSKNHVILGGLDGDKTACKLIKDGYLDSTGVQNLFAEAQMTTDAIVEAVSSGEKTPEKWMDDHGFALTQGNFKQRHLEMWGCRLLEGK
jgi:ABC-type sugar transport system substrate-binding protein